jgi:hypothetical protein
MHRTPQQFGHRRRICVFVNKPVAGFAVQAYFHNHEIMVTLPTAMQEIFMHMKEAV